MKKQKLFILLLICIFSLYGCSKIEKDDSSETDLYGKYSKSMIASNIGYEKKETYTFNLDNTYNYICIEKNNEKVLNDFSLSDKINNMKNINNDIIQLDLNNGSSYDIIIYKYKNMLGQFYKTEIPNRKKFDLFLKNQNSSVNEGGVFNKDGLYHYCTNYDNCTDDNNSFIKYERKGDLIYQTDSDGNWIILFYIVDDGMFAKECVKEK